MQAIPSILLLALFVPFVVYYKRQPLNPDYLWAAPCMLGAVRSIFRDGAGAT